MATDVLSGQSTRRGLARLLPFLGPAFIASVAYIDPGYFATNIQVGAQFGYTLLWVILLSNLMAMLIQANAAKLGIATGMKLAERIVKALLAGERAGSLAVVAGRNVALVDAPVPALTHLHRW